MRNTETQIRAKYVKKCLWHIYATIDNANNMYQIKTLVDEHTCPTTKRNKKSDFKVAITELLAQI